MTGRATGIHHFFVDPSDVVEGIVTITGPEAHHAARVLRVRPGERISVADGSGRVVRAVVTHADDVVAAEVRAIEETVPPRPEITLYQAIAKGDATEQVIARSVEMGVVRIVPFVAARTVVRWDEAKRTHATERWRAVALSAAKQCRSPYLTIVADPVDDPEGAGSEGGRVLVLHERTNTPLRDLLPDEPPRGVVLVVGPEGGLEEGEVESLTEGGAHPVTLGPRILRASTAGPVAAAIIAHVYGTLG